MATKTKVGHPTKKSLSRAEQIKGKLKGTKFTFVRVQDADFQCAFCGGKGLHGVVLKDSKGRECVVGHTCAEKYANVQAQMN